MNITLNKPTCSIKRLIFIIFLMGVFGAMNNATAQKLPSSIRSDHRRIQVEVSPQVELISIIQTIGNYPNITPFLVSELEFPYKDHVMAHFGPYAAHPTVSMFDRLSAQPRKLNFSAPSLIMLYTDQELQLRNDIELDDFVLGRIDGQDSLIVFLDLLKDFVKVSDFVSFFKENETYYQKIIDQSIEQLGNLNYIQELEDFYGTAQQSYHINLVSLYPSLGYGNSVLRSDGKREMYNVMGAGSLKEGIPFFGDERHFKYMIRHEFSHPFVNPLTEMRRETIKPYKHYFDKLPEKVREGVCGEWEECINEFIIRAITTWLAQLESKDFGEWAYQREKSRGVAYLDELLDKIDYYQANRQQFPTLNDYYPHLLKVFESETY